MNCSARSMGGILALAGFLLLTTGCRYFTNRYYDARDTIAAGVGVTHENKVTGALPPALGLYFELTDLLHLGAIRFDGYVAEADLRGSYLGPESSSRIGFLWWQSVRINQVYEWGHNNAFKDRDFPWCQRMESLSMRNLGGKPAKRLHYEPWANVSTHGTLLLHRGWQYWEYTGVQAAICDPFLTHFGVLLRLGFDLSELSDFLLGWTTFDFKHDDLTSEEYAIYVNDADTWGLRLVPVRPRTELAPITEDNTSMGNGVERRPALERIRTEEENTSTTTRIVH